MTEDEVVKYLHGRIDYRAAQVGGLEASIATAVRHLEHAVQFKDWNGVLAVINSLKAMPAECEAVASQYAVNTSKLDKSENEKPI